MHPSERSRHTSWCTTAEADVAEEVVGGVEATSNEVGAVMPD